MNFFLFNFPRATQNWMILLCVITDNTTELDIINFTNQTGNISWCYDIRLCFFSMVQREGKLKNRRGDFDRRVNCQMLQGIIF